MHDGTVGGIIRQVIRNNFTESLREQTFVKFADCVVNIFLGGGDATLCVTIRVQRQ